MTGRPAGTIDLHLHTTASDGRCTPGELVDRAARAGVAVLAVTDHDTTAAWDEVRTAAAARGLEAITGIEITATEAGRDLHVLGYLYDVRNEALAAFLQKQRAVRMARVEAIAARLAEHGVLVDISASVEEARRDGGRSLGRPQIARAMVAAGHVLSVNEAFSRWLERGRPGFVPREGPSVEAVIEMIHHAGGLASLAHPGQRGLAGRVPALAAAGLDALEAFHPDHDAALTAQYVAIGRDLGLRLTGGSDFHGEPAHGLEPGSVTLPVEEWNRLRDARS